MQLLGGICLVWLALDAARFQDPAEDIASALGVMQPSMQPAALALRAAEAGWSHIEVEVRRNDTLDQIFRRLELPLADLANLRAMAELRTALDRLKPGEMLTLSHKAGELMGLERRISPSEVLQVLRETDDSFVAAIHETPLTRTRTTTEGVISSSLFEAAADAGIKSRTAMALADLFGWDIDFVLDLREGDSFKLTYERITREGEYIGDGDILAARFVNQGNVFEAVRFVGPDGRARYFTPEGRSLRKAFLKAPLEFSRVSSVFNPSRRHPILNRVRAHRGVDYAAPSGTPVRAAGSGRVLFRGVRGGYGNVVEISHAGQIVTRYGHLSRFASGVGNGDRVEQGQVIGYVGMTGLASGPHLHFEFLVRGVHRNPQTAVRNQEATQIEPALRDSFLADSKPLLATLGPRTVADPRPVTR
jgi:murein DD-endopeptidase MepM/ murein hydrolase activator NlpD